MAESEEELKSLLMKVKEESNQHDTVKQLSSNLKKKKRHIHKKDGHA